MSALPPGIEAPPNILVDGVELTPGQVLWLRSQVVQARAELREKDTEIDRLKRAVDAERVGRAAAEGRTASLKKHLIRYRRAVASKEPT